MKQSSEASQKAFGEKCFDAWMAQVDNVCQSRYGCSVFDLCDVAFRDMYEDGESPFGAARAAYKAAGGRGHLAAQEAFARFHRARCSGWPERVWS
jgi:hypothetical protein